MELMQGEAGSQCGPEHQSDEEPPRPLPFAAAHCEQRVIHVSLGPVLVPMVHRLGSPRQQCTRSAPGERGSAEPKRNAPIGIVSAFGVSNHREASLLLGDPEVEEGVCNVHREQLNLFPRACSGLQGEDVLNCV